MVQTPMLIKAQAAELTSSDTKGAVRELSSLLGSAPKFVLWGGYWVLYLDPYAKVPLDSDEDLEVLLCRIHERVVAEASAEVESV